MYFSFAILQAQRNNLALIVTTSYRIEGSIITDGNVLFDSTEWKSEKPTLVQFPKPPIFAIEKGNWELENVRDLSNLWMLTTKGGCGQ